MCLYPLEPMLAKVLLTSIYTGCVGEIVSIVAMLSVQNPFLRPKEAQRQADSAKSKFAHPDGDHLTLLNVYESYLYNGESQDWCWTNFVNQRTMKTATDVRNQLIRLIEKQGHKVEIVPSRGKEHVNKIKKAILSGYFLQIAHLAKAGHYMTIKENP